MQNFTFVQIFYLTKSLDSMIILLHKSRFSEFFTKNNILYALQIAHFNFWKYSCVSNKRAVSNRRAGGKVLPKINKRAVSNKRTRQDKTSLLSA